MKTKIVILFLVSLIPFSCSKDNESESAISRFVNSTWAFYTENSTRAYYKYEFTNTTSGKYWYYKGTDNTNKFDFTYTADNKKLKIDYKINSVSAELDENGNLKVISNDATIVYFNIYSKRRNLCIFLCKIWDIFKFHNLFSYRMNKT